MKIFAIRHGQAEDRQLFQRSGKDDAFRPLTAKGKERSQVLGRLIQRLLESDALVVSSPYTRAWQTAEIIKREIGSSSAILESIELVPSAPPEAFASWLQRKSGSHTQIVVVGHEPQLSSFVSWCLGSKTRSILEFKKSGLAILEVESFSEVELRSAQLLALLSPKILEAWPRQ